MATVPTPVGGDRTSRVILLISLALNLFFLGLISAGPVKHLFHPHQRAVMEPSRTAAERIDRLAGVRDGYVEPSETLQRCGYRTLDCGLIADIGLSLIHI